MTKKQLAAKLVELEARIAALEAMPRVYYTPTSPTIPQYSPPWIVTCEATQ